MATENLFTPGKVRLYSGKYINVVEMTEDDICLEDIAHALALKCRWNGRFDDTDSDIDKELRSIRYRYNF